MPANAVQLNVRRRQWSSVTLVTFALGSGKIAVSPFYKVKRGRVMAGPALGWGALHLRVCSFFPCSNKVVFSFGQFVAE